MPRNNTNFFNRMCRRGMRENAGRSPGPGRGRRRGRNIFLSVAVPACGALLRDLMRPEGFIRTALLNWRDARSIGSGNKYGRIAGTSFEEIDTQSRDNTYPMETPQNGSHNDSDRGDAV